MLLSTKKKSTIRSSVDEEKLAGLLKEKNRQLEMKRKEICEKDRELLKVERDRSKALSDLGHLRSKAEMLQQAKVELMNKVKASNQCAAMEKKRGDHLEGQKIRQDRIARLEIDKLQSKMLSRERVARAQQEALLSERSRLRDLVARQGENLANKRQMSDKMGLAKGHAVGIMVSEKRSAELQQWIRDEVSKQSGRIALQSALKSLHSMRCEASFRIDYLKASFISQELIENSKQQAELRALEEAVGSISSESVAKQKELLALGVEVKDSRRFLYLSDVKEARIVLQVLFENCCHQQIKESKTGRVITALPKAVVKRSSRSLDRSDFESEYEEDIESDDGEDEEYEEKTSRRARGRKTKPSNDANKENEHHYLPLPSLRRKGSLSGLCDRDPSRNASENVNPIGPGAQLADFTVKQLQEFLRRIGLTVSGRKEDLFKRLLSHYSSLDEASTLNSPLKRFNVQNVLDYLPSATKSSTKRKLGMSYSNLIDVDI